MQIDRNLHAQFKRVAGESNNERMSKLLDDSRKKYMLIKACEDVASSAKKLRAHKNNKIKTLASALVVSIAVSVCSVAYVCVVNGWFL